MEMWRSKKVILMVLLAAVVLVGSATGVVLAQTDNDGDSQPRVVLLDRVAAKLGIDRQELEDAFAEAIAEIRAEALGNWLQNQVDQGKITQDEADQYGEWWQARPDVTFGFGFREHGGPRGFGGFGFRGRCGFGHWGIPDAD